MLEKTKNVAIWIQMRSRQFSSGFTFFKHVKLMPHDNLQETKKNWKIIENTCENTIRTIHFKYFNLAGLRSINSLTCLSNLRRKNQFLSCSRNLSTEPSKVSKTPQKQLKSAEETSSNMKISKLFPSPKNTLDNILAIVSKELGSKEYNPKPKYGKSEREKWICTYELKWPEEKSFTSQGKSKKMASNLCALEILKYLWESKKIDKKGVPVLYSEEDVLSLKKKVEVLDISKEQLENMSKIVDLHMEKIYPILSEAAQNLSEITEENLDEASNYNYFPQRFLGYSKYKCRETTYLPVSDYKEKIIDTINSNQVVVIKGEPGCGKSTRIPQYILEGWARNADQSQHCNIVVTEPRRIAAISLAQRVASERNEQVGSFVGYQVRFNSQYQPRTGRILYCTNGILLQQFKSDPNISKYSHIIIDEAHERDINTDLLLNMLRRNLEQNPNLKVVIMSATIDTSLFQNYFENSSLLSIPGFTYPVQSYYLDDIPLKLENTSKLSNSDESQLSVHHKEVVDMITHVHKTKPEGGAILVFLPGWEDIRRIRELLGNRNNLQVLCLHSRLQDNEQYKIFKRAEGKGVRKIILATNIAESSVTIDDVVYVIDTGIHKESTLDVQKGVMCLDSHWISKSSVEQRKGRAGRVQPGEAFHLYTRKRMESFNQFAIPEILRASLTKVVLDSKAFKENMNALEFFRDLPSAPSNESVMLALKELKYLDLIDDEEKLTPLGKVALNFQLEPKLSKTLINSVIYKCVTPIVDIVSIFSMDNEIFASGLDMREKIRNIKSKYAINSDHLAMMRIYEIWDQFYENSDRVQLENFQSELFLLPHKMKNLKDLRDLHFNYLEDGLKCKVLPISDDFSDEDELVKAVLLSGVGTFLTEKKWEITKGRLKKSSVFLTRTNQKASVTPESVNCKKLSKDSNLLLYINETRSNTRRITLIRETSSIPPIMPLLFSHKDISFKDVDKSDFSTKLKSDDQVVVSLAGTNLNFLMDRSKAVILMQCKLALNNCYDHYIFQLTKGGELNLELNKYWEQTLMLLSEFLRKI